MDPRDPPRLLGHIMALLRDHPQVRGIRTSVSGAINDPLFPSNPEIAVDLSDADIYSARFAGVLEFALCLHTRGPPRAESLGITTRSEAWQWVTNLIQETANDSSWQHADSMGAFADISTRASYIQPLHSTI